MQIYDHLWSVAAPHFLHLWAIAGPLVGILLGAWLTTKNQRKIWLLDNKRAEYRKLLTTLSDCGSHYMIRYTRTVVDESRHRRLGEATRNLMNVLSNRLFIADEIKKIGVSEKFQKAVATLKEKRDAAAFGKDLDVIMDEIRKEAAKDLS